METSNSTVTGSETFSTGLINWLYLLKSFLNSRSSALDEKQPEKAETKKEEAERAMRDWMRECECEKRQSRVEEKSNTVQLELSLAVLINHIFTAICDIYSSN